MKALTLVEYNRLVYGDAPDPSPGKGEVLIRVKACGILYGIISYAMNILGDGQ